MIVSPVMSEAAGDAKNTTGPATSSGLPMRPSGIRLRTESRKSASSSHFFVPGVDEEFLKKYFY